jgi:Dolichyl-phosphate-mannose-protein mannosyltransferase
MKQKFSIVKLLPESFPVLAVLGIAFIAGHMITGSNYPVFRDEFYYLDCADHPAFGYVDHPPFSIIILAIWKLLFGTSLISLRVLPAVCGALFVMLSGYITKEFGGNKYAQILTAFCVYGAPFYLGVTGFYSMNSFELLFWAALYLILLKIINSGSSRLWVLFGLTAGLGMMNKISAGFFIASMFAAIVFTPERKFYRDKLFWSGMIIAGFIFLPYVLWNILNDFPTREFMQNAIKYKISEITPLGFLSEQVININPFSSVIWIGGLIYLLFSRRMQKYKVTGFIYIFAFMLLALQNSKPYYLAAAYPVLFASGAIALSDFIERKSLKWLKPVTLVYVAFAGLIVMPLAIPVLPPESLIKYSSTLGITPGSAEKNKLGVLPQHFADRFGWEEMTEKVAATFNSLNPAEKQKTGVFARNYGEAGALNYYGLNFGLPRCMSGHNNHWLWGPLSDSIETLIIIGDFETEDLAESFGEFYQVDKTSNQYAMPFENDVPIFVCRKFKKSIRELWPGTKMYI